ncbi:MAG TPA: signal peptidase I [Nocardioidaceae bacterium]|nr:signal peptidase I [Nocardioidaceae bacterium]
MRRFLGWSALALVLVAILVPVVALTFSVQVQGQSMNPTLRPGDRLFVSFLGRGALQRFDLVDASFDRTAARAVKRVVGMPGDRISVSLTDDGPVVHLQPAGDDTTYIVENPSWESQPATIPAACCDARGVAQGEDAVVTVPEGSYWLVGDNWGGSDDSRQLGFVTDAQIHARLNFRLLPLGQFGTVPSEIRLRPAPAAS